MTVDVIGEAMLPLPVGEVEVVTVGSTTENYWATYVWEQLRETYTDRNAAVAGQLRWVNGLTTTAWG
jgi:hypothetical protein